VTAPHVGDYLTVNDTLPTPAPGRSYYFASAATNQGQTRYGRRQAKLYFKEWLPRRIRI